MRHVCLLLAVAFSVASWLPAGFRPAGWCAPPAIRGAWHGPRQLSQQQHLQRRRLPRSGIEDGTFDYFDVLKKDEFVEMLTKTANREEGRTTTDEEKIARQVDFLQREPLKARPAESPQLVGSWKLAFCGVGRGLQTEPVRKMLKKRKDYMFKTPVSSVSMVISADMKMRTEVVLAPEGAEESIVEESELAADGPQADQLEERGGFGRYWMITYLEEDLLIVRGRGPAEVYQRVA
mmetsp:Transcript_54617/g.140595  ORF Transcript_54617/g.140595 Transcript_54617/m.140595 type:complete len:235 (-) Transcript_54617:93-797(-)